MCDIVPGFVTWCNGRPDLRVLGHELGHNNGAYHSNRGEREYGNDFSIMGGSGYNMHFNTAGKVSMKWLDEAKHVKTVARSGGCFDFNPCIQTCTQANPCTFDLFAHDQGSYLDNRVYTVRVLTNQFKDENIWIEYRKNYPADYAASEDGLLLVWSIKRNSIIFGPTHLEDYDSITPSQSDSFLPIGKKWVYDYDNIGAVVEATQKGTDSMKVSVYFTDRIASTSDPTQETLLKGRNDSSLGCGTSQRTISLGAQDRFKVFQTMIQAETTVSITMAKVDCSKGTLPEDAGLYVYPTYPLQLELNANPDMANGAIYFLKFECQPAGKAKEVINGDVSVRSLGTPSAIDGYHYLDFSQANYFVLNKGDMASALDVEISLTESTSCYSACEGVQVSSSSSSAFAVVGKFVRKSFIKHPETGTDLPVFVRSSTDKQKLVYDFNRQAWTLTVDGVVFAEQRDKTVQTEYPHIINSWTEGISTSCFSRAPVVGTAGDLGPGINGQMDLAGMIAFGGVIVAVVVSVLAIPFYLVRVRGKRRRHPAGVADEEEDGFQPTFPGPSASAFAAKPKAVFVPPQASKQQARSEEEDAPKQGPALPPKRFSIFGGRREKKPQISFTYAGNAPRLPRAVPNSNMQVGFAAPGPQFNEASEPKFVRALRAREPYSNRNVEEEVEDEDETRARRASSIERYEEFMRKYESRWDEDPQVEEEEQEEEEEQRWIQEQTASARPPPPPHTYATRPPAQRGYGRRSNYVPAWERETVTPRVVVEEQRTVRSNQRGKCRVQECTNWSFDEGYCRFHMKSSNDV